MVAFVQSCDLTDLSDSHLRAACFVSSRLRVNKNYMALTPAKLTVKNRKQDVLGR